MSESVRIRKNSPDLLYCVKNMDEMQILLKLRTSFLQIENNKKKLKRNIEKSVLKNPNLTSGYWHDKPFKLYIIKVNDLKKGFSFIKL